MNKPMVFMNDNMVATSSRVVAEYFGKQHKHVLEAIETKMNTAENSALLETMFFESTYVASNGKTNREVIMNRDGFSLLAMGFTGAKALEFQLKFIAEFNQMETELKSKLVPQSYAQALLEAGRLALELEETATKLEEKTIQLDESKQYYSIKRMAHLSGKNWRYFDWKILKNESRAMELDVKKVFDANFPNGVNVYHVSVWEICYPEIQKYL